MHMRPHSHQEPQLTPAHVPTVAASAPVPAAAAGGWAADGNGQTAATAENAAAKSEK
jgi:hypothetical protein